MTSLDDAQQPCPVCQLHDCNGPRDLSPPRETICPAAGQAARTIYREVWGEVYREDGVMRHAGGPYWRRQLLKMASRWERLAAAARIAAKGLPE